MDENNKPIKIYTRKRPLTVADVDEESFDVVERRTWQKIVLKIRNQEKEYTFDNVFDSDSSQLEVYEAVVRPMVFHTLDGNNSTIVCYGQTGSGKSYTLIGEDPMGASSIEGSSMGIMRRSVIQCFEYLRHTCGNFQVALSAVEVYNEEIRDLLQPQRYTSGLSDEPVLREPIRMEDITEHQLLSLFDFDNLLHAAQFEKEIIATDLNKENSMTHAIFTLTTKIEEYGARKYEKPGKLVFVDLAGSQNIGRFEEMGESEGEMKVKKSLLILRKVIEAVTQQSSQIPFAESQLTNLLQNTFQANGKVGIIATVFSDLYALEETTNTLEFASMVHNAVRGLKIIKTEPMNDLDRIENQIIKLRQQLNILIEGDEFIVDPEDTCKVSRISGSKIYRIENLFDEFDKLENDCVVVQEHYFVFVESLSSTSYAEAESIEKLKEDVNRLENKQRSVEKLFDQISGLRETAYSAISADDPLVPPQGGEFEMVILSSKADVPQEKLIHPDPSFPIDLCLPGPSSAPQYDPSRPGPSTAPQYDPFGPGPSSAPQYDPSRPGPSSAPQYDPFGPGPSSAPQYDPFGPGPSSAPQYDPFRPGPSTSPQDYEGASSKGIPEFARQLWFDHPVPSQFGQPSDHSVSRVNIDESQGCIRKIPKRDQTNDDSDAEVPQTKKKRKTTYSGENADKCIMFWSMMSKEIREEFEENYLEYCNFLEDLIYQLLIANRIKFSAFKEFVNISRDRFFAREESMDSMGEMGDTAAEEAIGSANLMVDDLLSRVEEEIKKKK